MSDTEPLLCQGCDLEVGPGSEHLAYCGRCQERDPEEPYCMGCGSEEGQAVCASGRGEGEPIRRGTWPDGWVRGRSGCTTWWLCPTCARSMEVAPGLGFVEEVRG